MLNLTKRLVISTTLTLGLLAGGQASATPYSWDYSFNILDPISTNSLFDPLNTELQNLGSTFTGNFSFNSDDGGGSGGLEFGPGDFTHTGTLASLDETALILGTDSDFKPSLAASWKFVDDSKRDYFIDISFAAGDLAAQTGFPLTFFGQNLSIEGGATAQVPEPGVFALLGLGLAGLGWSRRRKA